MLDIEEKELKQVDVLLENYHTGNRIRQCLPIFWSLIAIKCVLAEYLVQRYDVPIAAYWVWAPSLSMGVVATLLFGRFSWRGFMSEPPSVRRDAALWGISMLCMMVVLILGFQSKSEAAFQVPRYFSLILSVSFLLHALLERSLTYLCLGVLWAAVTFYYLSHAKMIDLVSFAGFMFVFVVIPFGWKWWQSRQQEKGWSYQI